MRKDEKNTNLMNEKIDIKDTNGKEILEEIIEGLSTQMEELKIQYEDNGYKIEENEKCIESLINEDDLEFRIFSPRSSSFIYKDKIEAMKKENEFLLEENEILQNKICDLSDKCNDCKEALKKMEEEKNILEYREDGENARSKLLSADLSEDNMISYIFSEELERKNILNEIREYSIHNLYNLRNEIDDCCELINYDSSTVKLQLDSMLKNIDNIINSLEFSVVDIQPIAISQVSFEEKLERLILYFVQLFPNVHINYNIEDSVNEEEFYSIIVLKIIKNCIRFYIYYFSCFKIYLSYGMKDGFNYVIITDDTVDFDLSEYQISDEEQFDFNFLIIKRRVEFLNGHFSILVNEKDNNVVVYVALPVWNDF